MRLLLLHIVIFTSISATFAQTVTVRSSVDKILIGEPITLTLKVKTKATDSINFQPALNDELPSKVFSSESLLKDGPSFELLEPFSDTITKSNAIQSWIGTYVVTVWDSGVFILPGQTILINDSTCRFNDLGIEVLLVAPKKDVDLYDIKENYADIPEKPFSITEFLSNHWWWMTIIVIGLTIYFFVKKRKNQEPQLEKRRVSLKKRTLIAIEALEKERLWEKDKLKEHFIELSYILRAYLTTRYEISLLERTTHQTKILLAEKGLNDDTIDTIIKILSQSDMVKFAKSKPELVDILKISTFAKQIVAETSPLEIEDAE